MKIYGKESDYYDAALSYGQDPCCKWVRSFKKFELSKGEFNLPKNFFGYGNYLIHPKDRVEGVLKSCKSFDYSDRLSDRLYRFSSGYVFFCGKVYPFVKCAYGDKTSKTFYTMKSLKSFIGNVLSVEVREEILNRLTSRNLFTKSTTLENKLNLFFNQEGFCSDELHRISNVAIYIYYDGVLHEGGCLKHFQFNKVLDPFTCLQELDMYVSGFLGGVSPKIIEIADEYKIEGKGFDKVTSFRNMKRK